MFWPSSFNPVEDGFTIYFYLFTGAIEQAAVDFFGIYKSAVKRSYQLYFWYFFMLKFPVSGVVNFSG